MLLLITNSLLFYILWSSSNTRSINLSKFPHTAKVWTAEQHIHYFPWKIYFRYLSSFSKSITEDVKTPVIIQRYMHNCIQIFRYIYLFANSTSLYKIFHMQGDQFFLNPSSYFPYSSNSFKSNIHSSRYTDKEKISLSVDRSGNRRINETRKEEKD